MSRLRALLHVSSPRECNAQQPPLPHVAQPSATRNATVQQTPGPQGSELFIFTPPGHPANDDEALQERAAIMSSENGWDEPKALREARWQADRERCWRTFLRNAQRVLDAPEPHREALLTRYQAEATGRYGDATGHDMALTLRSWVVARTVH